MLFNNTMLQKIYILIREEGGGRAAVWRMWGDRESGRDRLSEPAAEVIGSTRNHPNVCREGGITLAVVRWTGESGEGRGGGYWRLGTMISRPSGPGSSGGNVFYRYTPLHPCPPTFKYYHRFSRGVRPQVMVRPVRHSLGRMARYWPDPVR